MHKKLVIYLLILLISVGIFAGLFPYPIFSSYTNVTENNMIEISNLRETELKTQQDTSLKVLTLDWNIANALIELNKEYRLIDLKSGMSFEILRIGGINHADIVLKDMANYQQFSKISNEISEWEKHPVYLQINENLFLSASLTAFMHGDSALDSNMDGHMCLHFKNSKTHGTKVIDKEHQKMIKYAQKNSNEIFDIL